MNARDLHRDAVVVDCHNDLAMSLVKRPLLGERGTLRHRWLPELRAGGVDVQVVPIYLEPEYPEAALRMSLQMLQRVVDEVEENADAVVLAVDGPSIRAALDAGKIAFILALEGCSQFGHDLELLRTFHRLGVRMISFTHWGRTLLADGSGEDETGSRLTAMGVDVLKEMERLGIVMDVSHLSVGGTAHVLEIASRPVIASHSNARAVNDHHRNLEDEVLRAIAASGGVIGVNAHPGIVDHRQPTLDRVMQHVDHLVEVAGVEHVGLGPDFVHDILDELYSPKAQLVIEDIDERAVVDGLARPADLPRLTEMMLGRGFAETDVRRILGENLLRVFDDVMGVPSAAG